jgi:hypothetical protein
MLLPSSTRLGFGKVRPQTFADLLKHKTCDNGYGSHVWAYVGHKMATILPLGVMPMRQFFTYLVLPIQGYNTQNGVCPLAPMLLVSTTCRLQWCGGEGPDFFLFIKSKIHFVNLQVLFAISISF